MGGNRSAPHGGSSGGGGGVGGQSPFCMIQSTIHVHVAVSLK